MLPAFVYGLAGTKQRGVMSLRVSALSRGRASVRSEGPTGPEPGSWRHSSARRWRAQGGPGRIKSWWPSDPLAAATGKVVDTTNRGMAAEGGVGAVAVVGVLPVWERGCYRFAGVEGSPTRPAPPVGNRALEASKLVQVALRVRTGLRSATGASSRRLVGIVCKGRGRRSTFFVATSRVRRSAEPRPRGPSLRSTAGSARPSRVAPPRAKLLRCAYPSPEWAIVGASERRRAP